jgi:hypothetical protein
MTRFVPVTVLMVLLATSGVVGADTGMLPSGANLAYSKLYIAENGENFKEPSDPVAQRKYFNLPHCVCSEKNAGKETKFQYLITLDRASGATNHAAEFWTGTGCDMTDNRSTSAMMCRSLTAMGLPGDMVSIPDVDALIASGGFTLTLSIYDVFAGFNTNKGCTPEESDKTIWTLMDTDGDGAIDFGRGQIAGKTPGNTTTPGTGMDTSPPPTPVNLSAAPSDHSIVLNWSAPTSRASDINSYQALCSRADGTRAKSSAPAALYQTTAGLCGLPNDPGLLIAAGSAGTTVDAGAIPLPQPLQDLDAAFICAESQTSATTSMTIEGLQNDVPYYVLLLAIDLHGNYAGTYFTETITPVPVKDFWEALHERGGKAEGGLCLLAETYGNDSALTAALRAFRDDTLGGSRVGRWLTEAYYAALGRLGAVVHGSLALRVLAAVLLAPLVLLALLWHWLSLPGLLGLVAAAWWYRRRRRVAPRRAPRQTWLRAPAMACAALIVLGAGRAHAGGGFQPYWESTDPTDQQSKDVPPGDPSLVDWHVGLRLGPYIPDVDGQVATKPGVPGPYEQMFGGYHILPMLDVDYIVWKGAGQLGIGGSAGYWQKTARPFTRNADLNSPNPERQPGNKNSFRLIPLELSATYRLTILDDNYGIPVVPFVRGGLAYYIWWVTTPDGHYARLCDINGQMCVNKALGASLGLQGAIGLSIRAERIDPSAAMSMQNSGVQHAGVYAELSLAKVDGFGSDTKLSVGDTTWFAGVDFEF